MHIFRGITKYYGQLEELTGNLESRIEKNIHADIVTLKREGKKN